MRGTSKGVPMFFTLLTRSQALSALILPFRGCIQTDWFGAPKPPEEPKGPPEPMLAG